MGHYGDLTCPSCRSSQREYRNPIGNHADEDAEPEYEWCRNRWHEPYFFTPPLEGQAEREAVIAQTNHP